MLETTDRYFANLTILGQVERQPEAHALELTFDRA